MQNKVQMTAVFIAVALATVTPLRAACDQPPARSIQQHGLRGRVAQLDPQALLIAAKKYGHPDELGAPVPKLAGRENFEFPDDVLAVLEPDGPMPKIPATFESDPEADAFIARWTEVVDHLSTRRRVPVELADSLEATVKAWRERAAVQWASDQKTMTQGALVARAEERRFFVRLSSLLVMMVRRQHVLAMIINGPDFEGGSTYDLVRHIARNAPLRLKPGSEAHRVLSELAKALLARMDEDTAVAIAGASQCEPNVAFRPSPGPWSGGGSSSRSHHATATSVPVHRSQTWVPRYEYRTYRYSVPSSRTTTRTYTYTISR